MPLKLVFVLFLGLGLLTLNACEQTQETGDQRPNVILILADDMGYGDAGAYNPDSKIPTPHIDQLAADGVRLTDAHSPSGVCTPTRYGILTGRYSWRSSLKKGVTRGFSKNFIEVGRTTIASMLQDEGYSTGFTGKWHLGMGSEEPVDYAGSLSPGPLEHGFDYYYGIPASLDMEPYLFIEDDSAVIIPTETTPDESECCVGAFWRGGPIAPGFRHIDVLPVTTEKSVAFIREKAPEDDPFLLWVSYSAPHTPWLPFGEYMGISGAGDYGDFMAQVDGSVGEILAALEESGEADNTLVIFTSDNGPYWTATEKEQYGHLSQLHLRGMKADIFEGGHRVPFVARWPSEITPGSVAESVWTHTDFMATIAAATGTALKAGDGEDSYNMLPVLTGTDSEIRNVTIHHSSEGMFAIRKGDWKLIEGLGSGGFTEPKFPEAVPGGPAGLLFNLAEDPSETTNRYQDEPAVVEELMADLNACRASGCPTG